MLFYTNENNAIQTLGRVSKYDSGTSMSAKAMLLIAITAFSIWLVQSLVWCSCFLDSSPRPPAGTRGTGSHHFSCCLWTIFRKEDDPSPSEATMPWSTYQNSVSAKLSRISYKQRQRYPKFFDHQRELNSIMCSKNKTNLTSSMLSNFLRAGRLMKISDLGLEVITCKTNSKPFFTPILLSRNSSYKSIRPEVEKLPPACFHQGMFGKRGLVQLCGHSHKEATPFLFSTLIFSPLAGAPISTVAQKW